MINERGKKEKQSSDAQIHIQFFPLIFDFYVNAVRFDLFGNQTVV